MLFNSWAFVSLVVVSYGIYYQFVRSEQSQVGVLILASLVFYGYSQPWLVLLLCASILINTTASYCVEQSISRKSARNWAGLGVVANLVILATFKYAGLLAGLIGLNTIDQSGLGAWLLHLPLPIGISFYTFQGISLVIDTFQARTYVPVSSRPYFRHLRDVFFFSSFFPQLVAGPVVKSKHFMPQIGLKHHQNIPWEQVFKCLTVGYFLKIAIADNLKDQTFWISFPYFESRGSVDLIAMLVGYSAQIFADFAGYSLIAIGVAALFGYQLPGNFNYPYISQSIAEFWRRWHISLSSWLREYLYVPLGGNRRGQVRTYINLMVVMFLGGLWHGAAWSFALWGLWHGIGLAVERFCGGRLSAPVASRFYRCGLARYSLATLRMFLVFGFVTFGWLLFKLTDISQAVAYLGAIFSNRAPGVDFVGLICLTVLSFAVLLYHLAYLLSQRNNRWVDRVKPYGYAVMLFLIVVNPGTQAPFVYFQF